MQIDSAKGLHGFLTTMARRRALDRLRRSLAYRRATDRLEIELKATYGDEARVHDFQPANSDLADLLHGVIGDLPVLQQEVVNLTFFEGLSQREILLANPLLLARLRRASSLLTRNFSINWLRSWK